MKNVHAQLQHTKTVTRMLLGNLHLTQELLRANQLNTRLLKNAIKGEKRNTTNCLTFSFPRQIGKSDLHRSTAKSLFDSVQGTSPCGEQPLPSLDPQSKRILTPKKKGEILKFHEGASRTVTTIQPNGAYVTSKLTGVERAIYEMIFNQSPRIINFFTLKARFCRHMKKLQPVYGTHSQKEHAIVTALKSLLKKKLIVQPNKKLNDYRLA